MADFGSRRARRRFALAASDPLLADIQDTIDKIDRDGADEAAARRLLHQVDLQADAFTPAFIEQLAADAPAMKREVLLKTLHKLTARVGSPSVETLLGLAHDALFRYWGIGAALEIFAEHGTIAILDDEPLLLELIDEAGPSLIPMGIRNRMPRPRPLLRLYEVAPDQLITRLVDEMRGPDGRRRLRAALATPSLMHAHPAVVAQVVRPLLNTLLWAEQHEDEDARDALQNALGYALAQAPETTDPIVEAAWAVVDGDGKLALLRAYEDATRRTDLREISEPLAGAIVRRAIVALRVVDDLELFRHGASTLEWICDYFSRSISTPFSELFSVLAELSTGLPSALAGSDLALERMAITPYRGIARETVTKAIISLAWQRPRDFSEAFQAAWSSAAEDSQLVLHLAHMLATLARHADLAADLLPLMESILAGSDTEAKAVILRILAAKPWPEEPPMPAAFKAMIVDSILGTQLLLAEPAVEAIGRIDVPEDRRETIATRLGQWAIAAAETDCTRMAQKAIESSLLVAQDLPIRPHVVELALRAVTRMHALDAAQTLRWRPELLAHPDWLPTVLLIFGTWSNRHSWSLNRKERKHLAREMGRLPASAIAPHLEDLVLLTVAAAEQDPDWGWYIADVVSSWGYFDEAVVIAKAALAGTTDSPWHMVPLQEAVLALSNFEFEAAVARGDLPAAKQIAETWRPAIAEAKKRSAEVRQSLIDALLEKGEMELARALAATPNLAD